MKSSQRHLGQLLISLTLGSLLGGCQQNTDQTKPQSNCQLQQLVSTSTALGTTEKAQTIYDYDPAGNLLKKALSGTSTYSAGGSNAVTTTETYAYTTDNYLTTYTYATSQRTVDFAGNVTTFQRTKTKTYTYANERLAGYKLRETVVTTNQRTPTAGYTTSSSTSTNYAYDGAGQLTSETLSFETGEQTAVWTYQNGRAMDYVEKNGLVQTRPLTLFNGLIIQSRFSSTQSFANGTTLPYVADIRSDYDDQRRLIKQQQVTNDTLTGYFTQTWQTGSVAEEALPRFKGHPVIQSPYGEAGVLTQKKTYNVNKQQGNAIYTYLDYTYVNQLNTQGLVTNTQLKTLHLTNGQTQPDLTTLVYTYSGCN